MKRVEHLEDRFLNMFLDGHSSAERSRVLVSIKNDRDEIALGTLTECRSDLAHHLDVEDVQWRTRKRDSCDAIFEAKYYVLKRSRHLILFRVQPLGCPLG